MANPVIIEGYQVFKESENHSGQEMIKEEPVDPEYGSIAQMSGLGSMETRSCPPFTDSSENVRQHLNQMVENRGKEQTVISVVEDLLRKNEFILAQSDAQQFKPRPKPIKPKVPDGANQLLGSVLQPKDPTAFCSREDVCNINEALVEIAVTEKESHTDTDLVCAVSSKTVLITQSGQSLQMDLTFYWCNFCRFKTDKKEKLFKHITEHRFHCKYCKYKSFSQIAVIQHSVEEHPSFAETGSNLKYCSFLQDILQRHEIKKRKMSDIHLDVTYPITKRSCMDSDQSLKMNVEEVDRNKQTLFSTAKVNYSKPINDASSQNSLPASNQTECFQKQLLKPGERYEESAVPSGIINAMSGKKADTAARGITVHQQSLAPAPSLITHPTATAPSWTPRSPESIDSSGVCWNCNYCGFVTHTQSILKHHLNSKHQGQTHKYVAMLVSSDKEMEKIKESDHQINQTENNDRTESGLSCSTDIMSNTDTKNSNSIQGPSKIFGTGLSCSDVDNLLVTNEAEMIPSSYKCAHCNFDSPDLAIVKLHLFQVHKGCVMYALDMKAVKLRKKRYVFFCIRSNCFFETKEVSDFIEHSSNCILYGDGKEQPEMFLIKSLEATKQFILKVQENTSKQVKEYGPERAATEYACVYCLFVSCNNTRMKRHVMTVHTNKKCVIRDLAENNKHKPLVYFCTHCLWETREEGELKTHMTHEHNISTSASAMTRTMTTNPEKSNTAQAIIRPSEDRMEFVDQQTTAAEKATSLWLKPKVEPVIMSAPLSSTNFLSNDEIAPERHVIYPLSISDQVAIKDSGEDTISDSDFQHDLPQEELEELTENVSDVASGHYNHLPTTKPNSGTSRYKIASDKDVDEFMMCNPLETKQKTHMKTIQDLKTLQTFFDEPEINESRNIHEIPATELSALLSRFVLSVKKRNGHDYEPSCLRGMICSFDRHLRHEKYGQSITNGPDFVKVRQALAIKLRQLRNEGKGNLPNKSQPLSDEDLEQFWNTDQLGTGTPDSILQTLWLYNTVHFGLRSRQDHRNLCWGDVTLKHDDNNREYLQYESRSSENQKDMTKMKRKLWSNIENSDRCPVEIYKVYAVKRPSDYCRPEHPFYIATTTVHQPAPRSSWFKRNPVGVNKLASMMKRMVKRAGLNPDKKLSNHSARKYLIRKLNDSL